MDATGNLQGIGELDHSQTNEYRIFGPPGTGKTTNLSRQIKRAVEKFGENRVLVTSFSRAAAAELVGRGLPIPTSQIGTLHSHCYRAVGMPEVAEANVEDWNHLHPNLAITPARKQERIDGDDVTGEHEGEKNGDYYLQQLGRFRGLLLPPELWPADVRQFASMWNQYKHERELVDFTDLIERAGQAADDGPGSPAVIFADEAQDLNPMQLALIRRWGSSAKYFIVAADDDQTVYGFTGATPEAVLDPDIPPDHKIILQQSYRVPRAVHAEADALIHRVARRQEKVYLPRDADGEVHRLPYGNLKRPEDCLLKAAMEHIGRDQTVMFLASCEYMLRPVIQVLRAEGIPFHNPYRSTAGAWNPLRVGKKGSTVSRILALIVAHGDYGYHRRPWKFQDLQLWAEWLQSEGVLKRGAKARIAKTDPLNGVTESDALELFEPAPLQELLTIFADGTAKEAVEWWRQRLVSSAAQRVAYPARIVQTHGHQALLELPKVIVGTIHSVKGGEADVVFLFPDLSSAGMEAWVRGGPHRDAITRLFYVGMTRARETLYVCAPEGTAHADI